MRTTDTIAAISTALSPSGIGIVRMIGTEAVTIADRIYRGKKKLAECDTHTINYGFIYDEEEKIDEVLVMLMRGPHSYSGEDTVEINCHGGLLVQQKILSLLLRNGAELAEPGEFTKRAFLNGKMDLSQAEAVADIIDASNTNALRVGEKQLSGQLSAEIKAMRNILLEEIAFIEAALDDPEHYNFDGYSDKLNGVVSLLKDRIDKLIKNSETGIVLKAGIDTVILGRPNAGKSSVYNLLTKSNKAIVTDIAGTTRDTLSENIRLEGISLNITDTAGLRESEDVIERIGVDRAKAAANDADMLIVVIDGSLDFTDEDRILLDSVKQKNAVVLINKSDKGLKIRSEDVFKHCEKPCIIFSAKEQIGLDELTRVIKELYFSGEIDLDNNIYVTSVRQQNELKNAYSALELVEDGLANCIAEDFLSIDLTAAYEALGTIIGETIGEEVIDEIFSKFCMGK